MTDSAADHSAFFCREFFCRSAGRRRGPCDPRFARIFSRKAAGDIHACDPAAAFWRGDRPLSSTPAPGADRTPDAAGGRFSTIPTKSSSRGLTESIADKPAAVLGLGQGSHGKTPHRRLPVNLKGDKEKHTPSFSNGSPPKVPVVLFVTNRDAGVLALSDTPTGRGFR